MSDQPPIPVHQELRTAPPLRPLALVANAAIIDVVVITLWLSFTSGMYASTRSMVPGAAIDPPWWVSPVAYAFVLPLVLPVLLRIRWNRRKIRRTIDGLCAKRGLDERAPARRVYWRRDDPGAWRGPAFANPVWSPAQRADAAQSSAQRPAQRWRSALLPGIAAGAGCAALLNFFSAFGPLEIAIPVLIVLTAALLSARTHARRHNLDEAGPDAVHITRHRGVTRRHAWEEHDLIILGTHAGTTLATLRERATGRGTRVYLPEERLHELVRHAEGEHASDEVAPFDDTVTVPVGQPVRRGPDLPLPLPPATRNRLLLCVGIGFLVASIASAVASFLAIRSAPATLTPSNTTLPDSPAPLVFAIAAACTLIVLALVVVAGRRADRRVARAIREHPPAPGTVTTTRPERPKRTVPLPDRTPSDLPATLAPAYEELVLSPFISWARHPLMGLAVVGGFAVYIFATRQPAGVGVSALDLAIPAVIAFSFLASNPALTLPSLFGSYPKADAEGVEVPRLRGGPVRLAWRNAALVVLGDSMGTTRCLLINTTTGERHALTILTRSLHGLLALQLADRLANQPTDDPPDSRPDRPPADTTG